jgi:DNA-binding GntR family transcriptional regulator
MSSQVSVKRGAKQVRSELRGAILRGDYAPRQRLIEGELADEYGASRFVIRNVLLQLAAESLVEIQPNRGARVREISVDEALEITEIRRAVEGLVTARAAERVSDAQVEQLRAIGSGMKEAVANNELLRYSELNSTLHTLVREIAGHSTASSILSQLNGQLVRHQFRLSMVPGRPHVSLPQHLAIIEAVCARDPAAAEEAMRAHIGSVLEALSGFASSKADRGRNAAMGGLR